MPTSRKAQQQINATKRPTEELPRKDDVFVEGFTWAEFHHLGAEEAIRNPDQVAVDLSGGKERQLWHYLGKTSTESKPQYTADPALPVHDPRSNFLSTIPKPLRPAPPPAVYAPYQQQQQQRQQPKPSLPAVYPAAQSWPTLATLPQQQHQQHQHQRQRAEKPYVYKPRKPIVGSTQQQFAGQFTSQSFRPIGAAASPAPLPGGASNHHPQQQQRDAFGTSYASKNPASTTTMAPPYSSTRFAPVGGSNGFPQLPGLTWPPAHMKSGHPPPPQPQSRVWSTTPSEPPPSARSTASRPAVSASQKYCFFQVHHNR
ncbi:hypothetical protein VTK73DRAFT_10070 [Phialemonium thermophilum]|uniref:Uncharacterized protein n=1 Tax=Phialemonium thermophilum TaxID=223376 RepID=A0ABR3VYS0_9PEZI